MTNSSLKNRLATDPGFAIAVILENNPEEVVERLHGVGYKVTSLDDVWAAIKDLINKGDQRNLKEVLSVPFISERADSDLAAAIGQVSGGMVQKSTNSTGSISAADVFGGLATGILYTLQSSQGQFNKPAGSTGTSTTPAKDNTLMWVALAGGGIIVLILLIALLRKK